MYNIVHTEDLNACFWWGLSMAWIRDMIDSTRSREFGPSKGYVITHNRRPDYQKFAISRYLISTTERAAIEQKERSAIEQIFLDIAGSDSAGSRVINASTIRVWFDKKKLFRKQDIFFSVLTWTSVPFQKVSVTYSVNFLDSWRISRQKQRPEMI